MRVIAGKYKGRRIDCPKGDAVRPTTDKVKEAMFGAIQFDLQGAVVLDAFAGSGALGIEALSRGAEHVDFIEKNPEPLAVLKKNIETIAGNKDCDIYRGDVLKLIGTLKQYDIVLLDPPYDAGLYEEFLKTADSAGILNEGCKIIAECRKKFDFIVPMKYNFVKRKDYGDISLWFLVYGE
jgi:16S rRNA (guanine966-N2)-methyltransferase